MALKSASLTKITKYALLEEQHKDAQGKPTGEPVDGATIFHLRRLTPRLLGHVKDQATEFRADPDAGENQMKASFLPHKSAIETVRLALVGWDNLIGEDGNALDFKNHKRNVAGVNLEVASDAAIDLLDLDWVRELAEVVDGDNAPDATEEKPSA